ncbi:riboflavin synthase [Candidatus Roizmanbacteria bacterium]|nr:riboflavin synthase [Candidatus Roizmanbacteria bacterium]
MFTGIITNLGKVVNKSENKLIIKTDRSLIGKLSKGTSIAVDGICLTVVDLIEDGFSIDFMPETEEKTNIRYLKASDLVNLELPATANSLLSGHIVQGHIDNVAKLETITKEGNSYILKFSIPKDLSKYIVEKGSIAVNGISLTVIDIGDNFFSVGIIPHTWDKTMLHTIKLGDHVNVEVDILAKYLKKLIKI